jgi:hypothetical protein
MKKGLFVVISLVLLMSCSKKSSTVNDNELPVISLTTPSINQTYTAGEAINITGTVSDNNSIAEVHIHVTNVATGIKYLDVHLYPGSSSTSFSNHDIMAAAGIAYKVEIIAIDRAVNEAISSVQVSCN